MATSGNKDGKHEAELNVEDIEKENHPNLQEASHESALVDGLMTVIKPKVFFARTREIKKTIRPLFQNMLVIWCPTDAVRPDFVATILGKYDRYVEVRNRWIRKHNKSPQEIWVGAVAIFRNQANVIPAGVDLEKTARSVRTILCSDLLNRIITAEALHPLYKEGTSRVLIKGKETLILQLTEYLECAFREFGDVTDITFHETITEDGVIGEVEYKFASQALAAALVMNDIRCVHPGVLTVQVEETEKIQTIMNHVEKKVTKLVSYSKVVPDVQFS